MAFITRVDSKIDRIGKLSSGCWRTVNASANGVAPNFATPALGKNRVFTRHYDRNYVVLRAGALRMRLSLFVIFAGSGTIRGGTRQREESQRGAAVDTASNCPYGRIT